jgi:23S rRNA (guanine745-N1)-methyltransferase
MLLCPVRDCHMALGRAERRLLCPRGHSFDVARSGYINLLQPQERRSKQPGDTVAAVAARRRLQTGPCFASIARSRSPSLPPRETISQPAMHSAGVGCRPVMPQRAHVAFGKASAALGAASGYGAT